ncbi:MAG: hypothetical protein E4H02_08630 [Lentisphaerales bacterium]|jgi:UDP-2,3-diacylglucosamine pyrophosphatase LpxH|nr:MAG: hypothetical protein E4H02_08630 [Lentisphaerales bacterium]
MRAVIVSDLHIGSRHFERIRFMKFLDSLQDGVALILDGDILDSLPDRLGSDDVGVLDRLRSESHQRQVVWVRGNHDEGISIENTAQIECVQTYDMGQRLHITHGPEFVPMPGLGRLVLRTFLPCRMKVRGEYLLSIRTIKKIKPFFNPLHRRFMSNAARFASEHGYAAIVCGHVHVAKDICLHGVRYLNAGTWTEVPTHYVLVEDGAVRLCCFP